LGEKKTEIICPFCGRIHKVVTHDIKRRKTMLCHSCSAREVGKKYGFNNGFKKGEEHPNWNGGKSIDGSGYIQVIVNSDSPFYKMSCNNGHRVREHRLVMAQYLGRCLDSNEFVHHRNGNKADNRIKNLQLLSNNSHYPTLHLKDLQEENKKLKKRIEELEALVK